MQRDRIGLEDVARHDNLLLATWKAARGKRHRAAVARFLDNLGRNLATLAEEILSERSPRGRARSFTIRDPKRRTITAACFADRVLHHAILNLAESRFERMLVESSYACRPGKGVHCAVLAVQRHVRRSDALPWVVQVDVENYFASIDHAILESLLAQRFKGRPFLALLGRIIAAGGVATPGQGLPIGSLTSQHFANAYLDGADRFLLRHPGVGAHVRYMDDLVWWCPSRAAATETLEGLRAYLDRERKLALKPSFHLGLSRRGIAYCGFRVRPGVVLPSSRKMTGYRAALLRIEATLGTGEVTEASAQRAYDVASAALTGCQSIGFRRRLLGATLRCSS
ncbi:MAG: reverse transcriptase/maturase family protein [Phycisphaerales bacterium]|jgi:retron-type reverse transcriptase